MTKGMGPVSDTLTKVTFISTNRKPPGNEYDTGLTLLFEPAAHSFAVGKLRAIQEWVPEGAVLGDQAVFLITNIGVGFKDDTVTYTVIARELQGEHALLLFGRVHPGAVAPESTYWLTEVAEPSGNDPRIERALEILKGEAQRKDSLADQLKDAWALIVAAGLCDAYTFLRAKE